MVTPLDRSKEEYRKVIDKIKSDSSVGIDAQYTHAIIIEYLQQIERRLSHLEQVLSRGSNPNSR